MRRTIRVFIYLFVNTSWLALDARVQLSHFCNMSASFDRRTTLYGLRGGLNVELMWSPVQWYSMQTIYIYTPTAALAKTWQKEIVNIMIVSNSHSHTASINSSCLFF